jgi:hypothetical protein
VLDVMLPPCRVIDALKKFRAEFPTVSLHLYMEALGGVPQMVLDRKQLSESPGPSMWKFPDLSA